MDLKALVFSLAAAFLFTGTAHAWEANLPDTALDKSLILVDKGKREFFYLEKNGEKIIRLHYPSIHGEIEGDKQVEGDLKTPEGVYFVRGKIQVPLDFAMYGNHAYALNYPNPIDRLRGKTGGGIWIHSKGDPIKGQFTQGCVAIDLANIKKLDEYLKPDTPVLIAQGIHSGFHKIAVLENEAELPGQKSAGAAELKEKQGQGNSAEKIVQNKTSDAAETTALTSENNIVIGSDGAEVVSALPAQNARQQQAETEKLIKEAEEKSFFEEVFMSDDDVAVPKISPESAQASAGRAAEKGSEQAVPNSTASLSSDTLPAENMPAESLPSEDAAAVGDKPHYGTSVYVGEPQEISEDEIYVRQATLDWNHAWQERSREFFDFYNEKDYSLTSGDFSKFRLQKEGLFDTLSWIYIAIGDVEVLQGPDYFVSWFKQYYVAPNHKTEGVRRLYWTKDKDGRYKVSAMEWFPKPVGLEHTLDDKIKKEVPELLENWRLAWERADIGAYASFYSEYAQQDSRKGLEAIKGQKQSIWELKKPKKVVFSDVKMSMEKEGLKVHFVQDYEDSSGYRDKGVKVLTLHPKGESWVIFKETWRRI